MPALGDTPITSYFSRSASSTKRKVKADEPETASPSGNGSTKRRKSSPLASSSKPARTTTSTRSKEVKIEEFLLGSGKDVEQDPNTPLNKSRKKGKESALPTPPTTGGLATLRRREPAVVAPPQPQTPISAVMTIPKVLPTPMPTPSTLMGPSTSPPERPAVIEMPSPRPTVAEVKRSVPSSQSHLLDEREFLVPSMPPPLTSAPTLLDFADDDIVPSSQSQPLLILLPSPRRTQRQVQPDATFEIPTSQSQERELVIPEPSTHRQMSPKKSASKAPQRTLSDEMFPIPVQESIFAGIFPDDGDLADTENPSQDPDGGIPLSQGSVTESETEDEGQDDPRRPFERSPIRRPNFTQLPITQASQSSIASYADASFSSLPDAVREFRSMFGEGDGSYPADFPESLR